MNIDDIRGLTIKGESRTLELRKNADKLDSAMRTACAFLNTAGGHIILGVSKQQRLLGVDLPESCRKQIEKLMENFEPAVDIPVDCIEIPGRMGACVVAFRLPAPSEGDVYCYDGKAYYREGTDTKRMPFDMMVEKIRGEYSLVRWEERPDRGMTPDDLDLECLMTTYEKAKPSFSGEIEDALGRFSLLTKDKRINNAGVVLFGKNCRALPRQSKIKMARFDGTDRAAIRDKATVYGNIFDQFSAAMDYCRARLSSPEGNMPIPENVLKEAILNAICHRDWIADNMCPSVQIFDDRVEVFNPGEFPSGTTPSDFLKKPHSSPANPRIMDVLSKADITSGLGRGIPCIYKELKAAGLPEPVYDTSAGSVLLTIRLSSKAPSKRKMVLEPLIKTDSAPIPSPVMQEKPSREVTPKEDVKAPAKKIKTPTPKKETKAPSAKSSSDGLNPQLKKVYSFVSKDPGINVSTIASKLKVSFRTATRYVASLLEEGLIERRGSKKTGGYFIKG